MLRNLKNFKKLKFYFRKFSVSFRKLRCFFRKIRKQLKFSLFYCKYTIVQRDILEFDLLYKIIQK
jgi:hypothetical protein